MVLSGECSCKAGQSGVGSHSGVLLLTLLNTKDVCTSQHCDWKGPATNQVDIESEFFRNIRIFNTEKDQDQNAKSRPYPGVYTAGPKVNPTSFVNGLLDTMSSFNTECP